MKTPAGINAYRKHTPTTSAHTPVPNSRTRTYSAHHEYGVHSSRVDANDSESRNGRTPSRSNCSPTRKCQKESGSKVSYNTGFAAPNNANIATSSAKPTRQLRSLLGADESIGID